MINRKISYSRSPILKQLIFLAAAGVILFFNIYSLGNESLRMSRLRKKQPYLFLGDRFRGIESITQKTPVIGYYTDKNLDVNINAMQFAQAQLVLAPSILDLNNTDHEYIIFDCQSPSSSLIKIKDLGALPLIANQYGIILARNPNTAGIKTKQPL